MPKGQVVKDSSIDSKPKLITILPLITAIIAALIGGYGGYRAALDNTAIGEERGRHAVQTEVHPTIVALETQAAQFGGCAPTSTPVIPINVTRRYSFDADKKDVLPVMKVCDGEINEWWTSCNAEAERLFWAEDVGYLGLGSLGCKTQLTPGERKVYTFIFPLGREEVVDGISADLYINATGKVTIGLTAFVPAFGYNPGSYVTTDETGWVHLLFDLSQVIKDGPRLITEIHFDVYLPPAKGGQFEEVKLYIDNLQLYRFSN